ncbi:serine hydrolase, partial [Burkholderia pseudomallei]
MVSDSLLIADFNVRSVRNSILVFLHSPAAYHERSTHFRGCAMVLSSWSALGERVDAAIDAALAQRRLVGAVVLVARRGELAYRRA